MIPLEIAIDYPIHWSFERALRDFIQNFYDSIGYKKFGTEFKFDYEIADNNKYTIVMESINHPFEYEWLIYVGGSTKKDGDKMIGKYGEGFKMSVLACIQCEYGFPIMESQNWRLKPCTYMEKIDDKDIRMLGYELEEREDDGKTRLIIQNVPGFYKGLLREIMLNFFFFENPLFGEVLVEDDTCVICKRSNLRIPYKGVWDCLETGILYCNGLARGHIPIDLAIMVFPTRMSGETRARETLTRIKSKWELMNASQKFSGNVSLILLNYLKKYWNDKPDGSFRMTTWYYLICILVKNICLDESVKEIFEKDNKDLWYIDVNEYKNLSRRDKERMKVWISKKKSEKDIVSPIFRLLGAESSIPYFKADKENIYDIPTNSEMNRIKIIMDSLQHIFPVLSLCLKTTEYRIYRGKGVCREYAYLDRKKDNKYKIKAVAEIIVFDEDDLQDKSYKRNLLKYFEIILSCFGTKRSSRVNGIFTCFAGLCIQNAEVIKKAEEMWNA